jgi:hypothetical protein
VKTSAELIKKICANPPQEVGFFQYIVDEIYKIELNGTVETHVKQLEFLFKTPKLAMTYLSLYVDITEHQQPLHELCRHIVLNKKPIPSLHHFGEGNLKYLFSNLQDLEALTTYHTDIIKPEDTDTLKEKSIKEKIRLFMKKMEESSLEKSGINIDQLSKNEKKVLEQIRKFNKRFKRTPYDSAKQLLELMKKSTDSDDNLPRFTLSSEEIGLAPGYYMTKLADDDIRAPLIGHFLDCCQHIAGAGSSCVEHAVTSEFGASYAIFKSKIDENGNTIVNPLHDNLIVGSWVWSDGQTGIGFDSVEWSNVNNSLKKHEIEIFYIEYAKRMLEKSPDSIQKIIIGMGGETPKDFAHGPINIYHATIIKPKISEGVNYKRYRDSKKQRILAHRECQDYYAIHALNIKSILKVLSDTDHPDLKANLTLNYSALLERYQLNVPEIPAWLKSIREYDFDITAFKADSNPNLGLWLEVDHMSVAMKLISMSRNSHPRNEIREHIQKHLNADLCNIGSHDKTLLLAAVEHQIPILFINAMFEAGADPNMGDEGGKTFANYFAYHRKAEEFDPEWITKYKLDLNHPDDQEKLPLIRSFVGKQPNAAMVETYLTNGADPHLLDASESAFVHMITKSMDWLGIAPSSWLKTLKLNLNTQDLAKRSANFYGLQTIAQSHRTYPEDSLGAYFVKMYSDKIATITSYDELLEFINTYHHPVPPETPLKILKLLKNHHHCCIALMDRLLSLGVEHKKYLAAGETYFTAIASNTLSWFQARWFKYFTIETDTDKRLQFQLFVRYTLKDSLENTSEEYNYFKCYAKQLSTRLASFSEVQDVIHWFEDKNDFDRKTSEQLCLIALLRKYNIDINPLMEFYYQIQGAGMAFQVTRGALTETSLAIAKMPGVDEFCIKKNIPTFSFVLLRDGASETNYPFIHSACYHVFRLYKTASELLNCLDELVERFKKLNAVGQEIFKEKILYRFKEMDKDQFASDELINRIVSLFSKLGIFKTLKEFETLESSMPWNAPTSIIPMPSLYADVLFTASFDLTLCVLSRRISTTEQFFECLDSFKNDYFQKELISKVGRGLFLDFKHINQMLPVLSHFIGIDGKMSPAALETEDCFAPAIVRLINDYASYKIWLDFSLQHPKMKMEFISYVIENKFTHAVKIYAKLNEAFPDMNSVNVNTLTELISHKNMKDFFELRDAYPLLAESWKLASMPGDTTDSKITETITRLKATNNTSTKCGLAYVYDAQSKLKKEEYSAKVQTYAQLK